MVGARDGTQTPDSRRQSGFGSLLLQLRRSAGLSQEELAERAQLSVRAVRDIERGRVRSPQRRSAELLGAALRLTPEDGELFFRAAAAERPLASRASDPEDPQIPLEGLLVLPSLVDDLAGRDLELAQLRDWAVSVAQAREGARSVATVYGPPGIGKTSLALELAGTLGGTFPDGCFFLDLRGIDERPVTPEEALERLLRALGMPIARLPKTLDERSDLLHTLLRDRRVLLILDNAADEAQVRPLLPLGTRSAALVTARRTLVGLGGAHHLGLDVLQPDASLDLLRQIIGASRVDDCLEGASRLAELCGHFPLALRIAGNRLAVRPGWDVTYLADLLADEGRRLNILSTGDVEIRAACELSYRQLTPQSQRLYRQLSLISGAEFGVELAAVLADAPVADVEPLLEELADRSLLQLGASEARYRLHDLLRLFARERLVAEEPAAEIQETENRAVDWLLAQATQYGARLDVTLPDQSLPGGRPSDEQLSPEVAYQWLEMERQHWLAAARSAARRERYPGLVNFAKAMHWYSDGAGEILPWAELFGYGVTAARALGDGGDEAVLLNFVGWAHYANGDLASALESLDQALALARRLGDVVEECWSHAYLSRVLVGLGRPAEAIEHGERASALSANLGLLTADNYARSSLAQALSADGRHEEAVHLYREVMQAYRHSEGQITAEHALAGESFTLLRLADPLAALDRWAEVVTALSRARTGLADVRGYRHVQAEAAFRQGEACRRLGDAAAAEYFRDALQAFAEVADQAGQDRARAALQNLGESSDLQLPEVIADPVDPPVQVPPISAER